MRPAETERHAETLGIADHDVCTPFAGWRQQGQREQVGRGRDDGATRMRGVGDGAVVLHFTGRARILQQHGEGIDGTRGIVIADLHLDAQALGAGAHDSDGLWVAIGGNEENVRFALARTLGQGHRLGGGGGFVKQRGIADFHAGQVGHHGLEIDQRFHAALGNFRLVGRIGGVPGRVLEHVAQNHVRRERAVVALADKAAEHLVAIGVTADFFQCLGFGDRRRQGQWLRQLDVGGNDRVHHRLERGLADRRQHVHDLLGVRADMAFEEGVVVFELAQGFAGHDRSGAESPC